MQEKQVLPSDDSIPSSTRLSRCFYQQSICNLTRVLYLLLLVKVIKTFNSRPECGSQFTAFFVVLRQASYPQVDVILVLIKVLYLKGNFFIFFFFFETAYSLRKGLKNDFKKLTMPLPEASVWLKLKIPLLTRNIFQRWWRKVRLHLS